MASIVTCPGCMEQLTIPESVPAQSRLVCPKCDVDFALEQTIQLDLPTAMLLSEEEAAARQQSTAPETEAPAEQTISALQEDTSTCEPLSVDAPLSSWEARLKKVLEKDSSSEPEVTGYETYEPVTDESTTEACLPEAYASEEAAAETLAHQEEPLGLKMGKFAYPSADEMQESQPLAEAPVIPEFQAPDLPQPNPFEPVSLELSSEEDEPIELERVPTAEVPPAVETNFVPVPQVEVRTNPKPKRSLKRRLAKAGILLLLGPVLGTLLGFYALLWIRGPEADYLNMSCVLPSSMLPQGKMESPAEESLTDIAAAPLPNSTLSVSPETTRTAYEEDRYAASHQASIAIVDDQLKPVTIEQPAAPSRMTSGVTAQEFAKLVAQAEQAVPQLLEQSAGDQAAFKTKAQAYVTLCRLAEKFDFSKQLGLAPQALETIEKGRAIFQQAAATPEQVEDLTYLASMWWKYAERDSQGIFFAGKLVSVETVGAETKCFVALPGNSGLEIPLVCEGSTPAQGQLVAVAGLIDAEQQVVRCEHIHTLP